MNPLDPRLASLLAEVDGTWTQSRNLATRSVTLTDVSRCTGQCPQAGGAIEVHRANGVTLTVRLDGSQTATWTDSNGESGTRDLQCGK